MRSFDSGMSLLGKGRPIWAVVQLLVSITTAPWAETHPVNGSQGSQFNSRVVQLEVSHLPDSLDGVQLHLQPPTASEHDFGIHNTSPLTEENGEVSQPVEHFRENDIRVLDRKTEDGFMEMDRTLMGDILEFLEVEALNRHDPALETPGGLKVLTQGGNHLEVTKNHDGSIIVNGSVVDGVMSLPDGTEIYTLEKFLEEHKHLMDEAFKHLATKSKSLSQNNGRNFVTKTQTKEENLEDSLQIPKPTTADAEVSLPFSISVSHVTEISTRTAPPEISIQKDDTHEMAVTEGLIIGSHLIEPITVDGNHEELYYDEVIPEEPFYEYAIYSDVFPEDIIHEEVLPRESINEQAGTETIITGSGTITETVHEDRIHEVPTIVEDIAENSTLREITDVTPLENLFSTPKTVADNSDLELKESTPEGKINLDEFLAEEINVQKLSELAPTKSTGSIPELSLNHEEQDFTTEHVKPTTPLSELNLKNEEQIPVTEHTELITTLSEVNLNENEHISFTEHIKPTTPTSEVNPVNEDEAFIVDHNRPTSPLPEFNLKKEQIPVTEQVKSTTLLPELSLDHEEQIIVTEHVKTTTLLPELSLDNEEPIPVTEYIEITTPLPELGLNDEGQIQVTEKNKPIIMIPELLMNNDEQIPITERISDIDEEFIPITELGPIPNEEISKHMKKLEVITEAPAHRRSNEPVTDFGPEDIVDNVPRSEISFETSVDFSSRAETSHHESPVDSDYIADIATELSPITKNAKDDRSLKPSPVHQSESSPKNILTDPSTVKLTAEEATFPSFIEDIPSIPITVEEDESISLADIWSFALWNQENDTTHSLRDTRVPRTILTPAYFEMINLVPLDSWHPLYDSSPENVALRTEFLMDYLVEESILPGDPRISAAGGLNVTNFVGKELSFKRDSEGYISVNGIPVLDFKTLRDGTDVYTLATFLFDHRLLVEEARQRNQNSDNFSFFNEPLGPPLEILEPPLKTTEIQPVTETMSTGVQPPLEDTPVTEALQTLNLNLIPRIPVSVTRNVSLLYDIWQYAVPNISWDAETDNFPVPKTIISPSDSVMKSLIPQGTPHPLYDETPENVELRQNFLLDYMVVESVESSDPSIFADGLSVVNLNGNTLVFKYETDGKVSINDIPVERSQLLEDGTWLYVIDGLLFDHKVKVEDAFEKLLQHTRECGFGELGSPTGSGKAKPVPVIPSAVDRSNASSLINLWRHAVRNQQSAATTGELEDPKTVLSPSPMHILSLVPVDGPNPLYSELAENVALRSEILRDYLIVENVDYHHARMTKPGGYTVTNLNGKEITFKRLPGGNLTVNGIDATTSDAFSNGPPVYNVDDVLFDHKEKVEAAFKKMTEKSKFGALGEPLEVSYLSSSPGKSEVAIPQIPASVEKEHGSSLLYLWHYALNYQQGTGETTEPMTVLYPEFKLLVNLVPPDALEPLYDNSPESAVFRREFILDYLVKAPVSLDDPKMSQPGGLVVKNLLGKELVFQMDSNGIVTVNGVITKTQLLHKDGVWTYGLGDFLFNHGIRLDKAYNDMFGYTSGSDYLGEMEGEGERPFDVVASLPRVLVNEPSVTMYHLWQRALDIQDEQGIPRDDREPKTILSLPIHKVVSFAPFGVPHPMSDRENASYLTLRREIVNDYLLLPFVSPLDKRFSDPEGVTFRNYNNKPIRFKKIESGNHTIRGEKVFIPTGGLLVNNVLVTSVVSIKGHIVYSISDYLFDHEEKVGKAVGEFDKTNPLSITIPESGKTRTPSTMSIEDYPNNVPPIPSIIESGKLTKLINLWRHALDDQDYLVTLNDARVPKNVLSPGFSAMNMVLPGAPHPLFDSRTPENAALRNEIVLDYIALSPVCESYFISDQEKQFNVYTVTNLNGKLLNFTKNPSGKFFVNGVGVERNSELPDGTVVYYLEDFLFDHRARVKEASDKFEQWMLRENPGDLHLDRSNTPAIKETIPKIPEVLVKEQATTMIDMWRIALRHQNPRKTQMDTRVPKTVISPEPKAVVNLIPLVDETNASLRAQFLLDYLLPVSVGIHDPRMSSDVGLTVENFNGRELVFHKNANGLTINGVPVTKDRTLVDGTEVYRISRLLFEHRRRIDAAFEVMNAQDDGMDRDTGPTTDISSASVSPADPNLETVPGIPDMVQISGPEMLIFWNEAVIYQGASATARDGRVPQTVLSPIRSVMAARFPPGVLNPLLDSSINNVILRIAFLRDLLIMDSINMKGEFLEKDSGRIYKTLSGKKVKIIKNASGDLTVNGVGVESVEVLRDGTLVFNIKDFLFDHLEQLDEAAMAMNDSHPKMDAIQNQLLIPRALPVIPEMMVLGKHSSLLQFWQLGLEHQQRLSIPVNTVVPQTVLNPSYSVMGSLIPEDVIRPLLYDNKVFWTEMVLDYLIPQSLSLKDRRMKSPEGLHVTNLNGKDLLFKGQFSSRNPENRLTVNGVDITKITTLADGTQLYELADLLFDHKEKILVAVGQLNETFNLHTGQVAVTTESDGPKEPRWTVPSIPLPAAITPSASQTHLWAYNQHFQDTSDHLKDDRFPRTILSPNYKKLENLVPNDDRHPLYKDNIQHNIDLRAEFLLNYLVLETIEEMDTRITQSEGLTVLNMMGKNITFMMNNQGDLVVNGVQVEKVDNLDNNMKVYHLADFLFDHSDIQTLSDEYNREYMYYQRDSLNQRTGNSGSSSANESIVEATLARSRSLIVSDLPQQEPDDLLRASNLKAPETDVRPMEKMHHVPSIPDIVESSELSLINLWRYSLRHQDLSFLLADSRIPMTILSPINDKMQNLVPADSPHPLYDDSPESVAFRTEFLLDYLLSDPVDVKDTRIIGPDGLIVQNLNGKDLLFTTDKDGNLMVSGVPVEDVQTLPDGTQIYTLSDFLFSHKARVNEALQRLSDFTIESQGQHLDMTNPPKIKTEGPRQQA